MSTTTYEPGVLDIAHTSRVPLTTLVKVELRKMVDTRAGMWLLIIIGAVTGIATLIFGLVAPDSSRNFGAFIAFAGVPQSFLLPVLGILLITQEWGQRTGMVTFSLEPHRGRVIGAKVLAALVLSVAAIVLAFAFASLATVVFGGTDAWSGFAGVDVISLVFAQVAGTVQGLAYGLLFLTSAAAIVTYFVLPQVVTIVVNVWPWISDKASWIDFGTAQGPLFDFGGNGPSGEEWSQILVTGFVWVVLPFAVGLWRVLRAEIK